jgi:hypothetical protein
MKKKPLASILITVCAALAGAPACTTDATTGRRTLSPEAEASIQRIATHALTAAEAAAIRQIDASLKVESSGK